MMHPAGGKSSGKVTLDSLMAKQLDRGPWMRHAV
jgi:hypothetical protein